MTVLVSNLYFRVTENFDARLGPSTFKIAGQR